MDGEPTRALILAQRCVYPEAVRFDEKTRRAFYRKESQGARQNCGTFREAFPQVGGYRSPDDSEGKDQRLVAITFGGSDQNVMANHGGMQASGN